MKYEEKKFFVVTDDKGCPDCNNGDVYRKFNELTGLDVDFEIEQEYGTSCYGIMRFNEKYYPTLEKLEEKFKNYKLDSENYDYTIDVGDVFDYLRRKGILPEVDLLFNVDY